MLAHHFCMTISEFHGVFLANEINFLIHSYISSLCLSSNQDSEPYSQLQHWTFYFLLFKCWIGDEEQHKSRCSSVSSDCDPIALPMPPGPPSSRPPPTRLDFETLSEKYWGEILERTVSSSSLQALQRAYGHQHSHQPTELNSHRNNELDLSNGMSGNIGGDIHYHNHHTAVNLSNFSSSEPRLCEHFHHDINCAKSKALLNDTIRDLPNM